MPKQDDAAMLTAKRRPLGQECIEAHRLRDELFWRAASGHASDQRHHHLDQAYPNRAFAWCPPPRYAGQEIRRLASPFYDMTSERRFIWKCTVSLKPARSASPTAAKSLCGLQGRDKAQ